MEKDKKYNVILGLMIFFFIIIVAGCLAWGLGYITLGKVNIKSDEDVVIKDSTNIVDNTQTDTKKEEVSESASIQNNNSESDNSILIPETTVRTYRFFGYSYDGDPDMYTTLKLYSNGKYDLYVNNCEGLTKYSDNYIETESNITLTGSKSIVFQKKNNGNVLEFNYLDLGACNNDGGGKFALESYMLEGK